MATLICPK